MRPTPGNVLGSSHIDRRRSPRRVGIRTYQRWANGGVYRWMVGSTSGRAWRRRRESRFVSSLRKGAGGELRRIQPVHRPEKTDGACTAPEDVGPAGLRLAAPVSRPVGLTPSRARLRTASGSPTGLGVQIGLQRGRPLLRCTLRVASAVSADGAASSTTPHRSADTTHFHGRLSPYR